ncbi:MAG: aminotransferase class V-fold PLP-dependent enzyme, partial [Gemmatimonadota bacterium]
WVHALERYERVSRGYQALLEDATGDVTLASNTHELVVRFLSALPWERRRSIVTTDAEFHSIRRQVDRLAETGRVEVVKVPGYPAGDVAARLAAKVDEGTACVLVSAVFFERGHVVPGLRGLADACARHGAELLVDAYHALGAMPFRLTDHGLDDAFVVGGGYKYLQLGEGNCFLRTPPGCDLRPVYTGWFSEFGELGEERAPGEVRYGKGSARFAGSTYDPTSHYRGAAVLDFFDDQELTPELLREVSQHQVGLLVSTFEGLDLDPAVVRLDDGVDLRGRGGFLALTAPDAAGLSSALRQRGVHTDSRGHVLRFGPAPYLADAQVTAAMEALGEVVSEDSRPPR